MSSGYVHARATIVLAPLIASLAYISVNNIDLALQLGLGCLIGVFLTPDLDIDRVRILSSSVMGKVGNIWRTYWYVYSRWLPHRSFLSHFPIVGTLVRLAYLGLLPLTINLFCYYSGNESYNLQEVVGFVWDMRWIVAGLTIADLLHYLMDIVSTEIKIVKHRIIDNQRRRM